MEPQANESDPKAESPGGELSGIGARIVSYRKLLGWTQRELARRMPISHHRLSKLERSRALLNLVEAVRLARALAIDLDALVLGREPACPPFHSALKEDLLEFLQAASPSESAFLLRLVRFLLSERHREEPS